MWLMTGQIAAIIAIIAAAIYACRRAGLFTRRQLNIAGKHWAPCLSGPQQHRFITLVRRDLLRRRWVFTIREGCILRETSTDKPEQLQLIRLAERCSRLPEDRWPDLITGYFDAVSHSHSLDRQLDPIVGDFAQVRHLLSVRMYPGSMRDPDQGYNLVQRIDLPGVVSHLVFEMPHSVRTVRQQEAQAWGRTRDELFQVALDNLHDDGAPSCEMIDLHDGVACYTFSDESFFTASHALLLDYLPDCEGTYGSIVAIPTRHTLVCYPIEDLNVVKAINVMQPVIASMYDDGPGSISQLLYWHNGGRFMSLPDVAKGLTPGQTPAAFMVVLDEMAGTEDGEAWSWH